jgi:hypothetical protein
VYCIIYTPLVLTWLCELAFAESSLLLQDARYLEYGTKALITDG